MAVFLTVNEMDKAHFFMPTVPSMKEIGKTIANTAGFEFIEFTNFSIIINKNKWFPIGKVYV